MAKAPVIALLGGGQLGRMFIENALRYGVAVHVLDPDAKAPCAGIATRFVTGDFRDRDTVLAFARDADVVGIEIEQVSVEALEALQRMGKRVIPDPGVLRIIQDKGLQKRFYAEHGIPTAPFALIEAPGGIAAHARLLPAFLKTRTGGYDGKGVMPIDTVADAAKAFDAPAVLEERADIALELAVIVVRNEKGTEAVYDPVEMVFDPRLNLVDHLRAPARIPHHTSDAARRLAKRVAEAFGAPGLYAVEMFLTKDDELLVNETAPRAHNSGHHTIEACASSQFDQLLRVYMGWPLGDTALRGRAAMINLVGEGGTGEPEVKGLDDILHIPGTFVHHYGKHETRTGRKMGHVTAIAADDSGLDQAIAVTKVHGRVVPRTSPPSNATT
ncbi:MAG: 5-(carboxyamino)imidazole ribonucleotide synthase [Flavobacteriales bacterium]|nr:MAG: 5-(carboxyamino)imidazole ribonucleotide synthase [Flavobacteriales bacterium]